MSDTWLWAQRIEEERKERRRERERLAVAEESDRKMRALRAELEEARREKSRLADSFREMLQHAVSMACTCGGDGPGDCCSACEVWHLMGWVR
jgi:DNA-binding IclR family transcriptional regulator